LTQNCAHFPEKATAGLNFQASVDYAADWTLTAIIRGPSAITLTATADGTAYTFTADAATTAAWAPGRYAYSIRATNDADVLEVSFGIMEVLPDLAAVSAPYDARSDNEKALEAIEAVLGKRATLDQDRYKINNRELWRTPISDLLKLRDVYRAAVRRERARNAGRSQWGRLIPVTFR
jgi:hypothetical protein